MNQARRLGKSFEDVHISKVYSSDLKRAHWTALQIATQNKSLLAQLEESREGATDTAVGAEGTSAFALPSSLGVNEAPNADRDLDPEALQESTAGPSSLATTDRTFASVTVGPEYSDDFSCSSSAAASSPVPSPRSTSGPSFHSSSRAFLPRTVTTTNKLREQFFGLAEGQNWKTGFATSSNMYHNRAYKFEQGESLEDVHARAQEIIHRCIVPWLVKSSKNAENKQDHIVIVAHGIVGLGYTSATLP